MPCFSLSHSTPAEKVHMNLNLMIEMTPSLLLYLSWSLHNFYNRFAFCISIFYCHCLADPPSLPWDRHSATEIIHHIRFALCRPPRRQHAETMTLFFSCSGGQRGSEGGEQSVASSHRSANNSIFISSAFFGVAELQQVTLRRICLPSPPTLCPVPTATLAPSPPPFLISF